MEIRYQARHLQTSQHNPSKLTHFHRYLGMDSCTISLWGYLWKSKNAIGTPQLFVQTYYFWNGILCRVDKSLLVDLYAAPCVEFYYIR